MPGIERIIALHFPGWEETGGNAQETQTDPAQEGGSEPRDFDRLFARLTEIVPQLEAPRPGLVLMRARGPARYYGGEERAASALLEFARGEGEDSARAAIADGRFAAEQAALIPDFSGFAALRGAQHDGAQHDSAQHDEAVRIVPPGESARFLAPLPISCVADEGAAELLSGLGIYTLGAFAALPEDAVLARFGAAGVRAHRQARGENADAAESVRPQQPARDFELGLDFEPPLDGAEHLAFACRSLADRFSAALAEERLVCTSLRVTLSDDIGARYEHEWSHPRMFTAEDIVARIRWQAAGIGAPSTPGPRGSGSGTAPQPFRVDGSRADSTGAGISAVRIAPIRTDRAAAHEPGLWSTAPDERVHHHLSRAQSLLGHRGVGTVALDGGRLLLERQRFTPWGTAPKRARTPGPWPGSLPGTPPMLVFTPPLRARLLSADGSDVGIDADDLLTAPPAALGVETWSTSGPVRAWSKPWPIREHWWEQRAERFRVQLELEGGDAWLLLCQRPSQAGPGAPVTWFAEGRYD